jgi:hypothetical protein
VTTTMALRMVFWGSGPIRCSRGQGCSSAGPPYQTLKHLLPAACEHLLLFAHEHRTAGTSVATLGKILSRMMLQSSGWAALCLTFLAGIWYTYATRVAMMPRNSAGTNSLVTPPSNV